MERAADRKLGPRAWHVVFAAALAWAALIADEAPAVARRTTAIAALTSDGQPNVQSEAAIAIDSKTGKLLYAKNPDKVRAIASTGKIFVAMVARRREIDLNALTKISEIDAKFARGGSRTRLVVGHKFRNQDLLRAMLIASDNRAPTAIGRAVGLTPKELIRELNLLAKELGLKKTKFTDPSGLRGNTSTAREMAKALATAMKDPFLAELMSTKDITIRSVAQTPHAIPYRNTNRSLHSERHDVTGGKTGFTNPAGYCLLIAAEFEGRPVHMAFFGAKEKLTRFGDFGRVAKWMKSKLTQK
ncbi:MAG: D-alanyl-D-alanine carboxypeptidase [Myxococcales bacterium]|nr:D-alanyl-D-alanine carboxypeptidase [Myxococcales bacterium]